MVTHRFGRIVIEMLQHGLVTKSSTTLWPLEKRWGEQGEYWPWDERNMEVYAAMVDSMDQGIGKIVDALETTNQFNNTLVCYMQDNGGYAEGWADGLSENQERQLLHSLV